MMSRSASRRSFVFASAGLLFLLNLLLNLLLVDQVSSAAIPGFNECVLNNRRYAIGEVFHPVVEVDGKQYEAVCYDCTCQPTTIAQCEEIQCQPVSCDNPITLDGQCCPICVEPDLMTGPRGCIYEGLSVPHGDHFHPPSMLQAYEENKSQNQTNTSSTNPYCIECSCNDGSVECSDVSMDCPVLNCDAADAVVPEGSCCPSCPTIPVSPGPDEVGCYDFDGTFYSDGESWHPTLPGQGQVPCLNCTCIDGVTRCQKLPCPPVPTCGPDDPIEVEVLCCPKCNPPVNSPPPVSTVTVPGDDTSTTEEFPDIDLTPNITPCNTDKDYSIKVFKHPTLDAVAIEDTNENSVGIYEWIQEINENGEMVLKRNSKEMTSDQFTELHRRDYTFIGYTIPRRVAGLSSRESKRRKIEQCTENCSSLVVNMLRVVTVIPCSEERK